MVLPKIVAQSSPETSWPPNQNLAQTCVSLSNCRKAAKLTRATASEQPTVDRFRVDLWLWWSILCFHWVRELMFPPLPPFVKTQKCTLCSFPNWSQLKMDPKTRRGELHRLASAVIWPRSRIKHLDLLLLHCWSSSSDLGINFTILPFKQFNSKTTIKLIFYSSSSSKRNPDKECSLASYKLW